MRRHHNRYNAKAQAKAMDNKGMKVALILLFVVSLLIVAYPAWAQDAAVTDSAQSAVTQELSKDMQKRRDLAEQMHQIWPIRVKVEKGLDQAVQNMTFSERAKFKAAMRRAIDFDKLEANSITTMAETFNTKELQGMVDFYGSPTGRAVSAKVDVFQRAIEPTYVQMLDKALLDIRTGIPR